ncbi:hypothetical protein BG000_001351 [Podila horticola]|nr:hypothetical protein BG000_001351 [Podila horticola]
MITKLLPHITNAIAETLTFADLVNCVRVNHEWNEAFARILYEDVVTFRSKQARPDGDWDGCEYFVDANTRLIFARYCLLVRGLTCEPRQLANILLETLTLDSLIEINYILDENATVESNSTSLDTLTKLITCSPRLQAVSIENIAFKSEKLMQRLLAFVNVLDQYPAITCVYFDGLYHPRTATLGSAIWKRLWARVPLDSDQHIKTLVMLRPELLTRSNRGPSRGWAWTPRERPMKIKVPETDLWCDRNYTPVGGVSTFGGSGGGGRWEDELWSVPHPQMNMIAVVQAGHSVHVEHSDHYFTFGEASMLEVLDRCHQHAQEFMIGGVELRDFWAAFPSFPKLTAVDINYVCHWMDYDNCVATEQTQLASYRLIGHRAYSPGLLVRLANHFDTLMELDMDVKMFAMKEVCNILANTPRSQSIRIPVVMIDGFEPEELPEWASRVLEKISLGLYFANHRHDLNRASSRLRYDHELSLLMELSLETTRDIAPLFMARINEQGTLRELELSFNHRRRL